jgi:tripartite-type tricarboxylate transporter receptor subunit TctC
VRSGTPKPIVEKIARDIALIAKQPEIKKQFEELGDIVDTSTPDEFTDLIRTESARMTKLIKRLNITGQ